MSHRNQFNNSQRKMSNKKKIRLPHFDHFEKRELQKIGDDQKNVKQKKKKFADSFFFHFWRQKINSMKDDSTKSNEN